MTPANSQPVRPWTAARHIDINGDLHLFFDTLVHGKRVLDVGAGLGRSKARIRHNQVTTYDPSPAAMVDAHRLPDVAFDVVTAFEVIEHILDDRAFLETTCRPMARQAIFLTTPNWEVARCQSADHYREYTHREWEALICGTFPEAVWWWGAAYKDGEGGWADLLPAAHFRRHRGRKHLVLIDLGLGPDERAHLRYLERRGVDNILS